MAIWTCNQAVITSRLSLGNGNLRNRKCYFHKFLVVQVEVWKICKAVGVTHTVVKRGGRKMGMFTLFLRSNCAESRTKYLYRENKT